MSRQYDHPAYDAVPVAATTAYDILAQHGRACTIVARAAGNLVATTKAGTERTLACLEGEHIPVEFTAVSASSAIAIWVLPWGRPQ